MNNRDLLLQAMSSDNLPEQRENYIKAYSLESFAKEVDYSIQTELLTRLILDHSDITRKLEKLNKKLSRSEKMLMEAQKIAMLGSWDIYLDTGKSFWSKSMYEIIGADFSLPGSTELFLSHVHPEDLKHVTQFHDQIHNMKEPWTTRYRLLMDDGQIKWIHIRFNPTVDSNGRIVHYCGTIQDITEMKNAEEELEKYSQHLEKLVEEKVQEISASQMATIYALVKLSESRDDETGKHIERTANFCQLLAEKARSTPQYADEIDDKFIDTIYKASPLHDIGKVGISDNILLKPGKLTEDEFAIMKTHVQIGYQTLAKVGQQYDHNDFLKMGLDIALYHHEKWDGSGYIEGLSGKRIPLAARIMAISDVYDALRTKRVYKEAFSHESSMDIIVSSKGSHFDPELVDIFIQTQDEFSLLYESIK